MRLVLPYEMSLTELLKEKTIFLSHRNTEPVKGDKKPGNIFGEDGRTKPLGHIAKMSCKARGDPGFHPPADT